MALLLNTRVVDDVVVVEMSGRLTVGEPVLLNAVRRLVADGRRKFVLNLGNVSYVDSCGLGQLVATYTSVRNREGNVNILNPTERARGLLEMTKLLTVFDTFEAEADAIRMLTGGNAMNA